MKRLFMIAAMAMITLTSFSQNNNLLWTMKVKVKMDKKLEWEKKMLLFTKTHMPQLKYRVWEVIAGENTGDYVIVVGPTSYKEMDVSSVSPKGEALMKTDGQGLDALCQSTEVIYYNIVQGISSTKSDRKLKYQVVNNCEINMGTWGLVSAFLNREKEAWEKAGASFDEGYLRPSNSGVPNSYVSVRFVEKMEELESGQFSAAMNDMYDKAYGDNAWYRDWHAYMDMLKSVKSEIRMLRNDLSNL